jgi:hypothetical protein
MKKSILRSIGIGSVILTATAAGAWFLFFSEPAQKKNIPSPLPSQTVPEKIPQQDISLEPGEHEQPPENPLTETAPEEPEQNSLGENVEKKIDETAEPAGSNQDEFEKTTLTASDPPISSPLSEAPSSESNVKEKELMNTVPQENLPQDDPNNTLSAQQYEEKTFSGPSCTEVSPTLSTFINQLEQKQYSKEANINQPLQEHFNALATQLVNNPPVVTHETDELYTLLTNTAHFFRILGRDNMELLQKVVKQEHGEFEKIAAEMYRLSLTGEECISGKKKMEIPFTSAYEYAGFFLNTLGGRSYLFRREPGTRLLVNYYAVLILDQANQKNQNIYGLNMAEYLPWLIQEMEANNRLTNKEGYLDKLYELSEKYQALP